MDDNMGHGSMYDHMAGINGKEIGAECCPFGMQSPGPSNFITHNCLMCTAAQSWSRWLLGLETVAFLT